MKLYKKIIKPIILDDEYHSEYNYWYPEEMKEELLQTLQDIGYDVIFTEKYVEAER